MDGKVPGNNCQPLYDEFTYWRIGTFWPTYYELG